MDSTKESLHRRNFLKQKKKITHNKLTEIYLGVNNYVIYLTLNNYRNDDINKVVKWLSNKSLEECYKKIEKLHYSKGLTLKNLINELTNYLINYDMDIEKKKELFIKLSEIEFNQINITNNKIQLCSIISAFKLVDFNIKNKYIIIYLLLYNSFNIYKLYKQS